MRLVYSGWQQVDEKKIISWVKKHSSDQTENNVHKIITVQKQIKNQKRKYLKTSAWKYNLLLEMKSHKQIANYN